MALLACVMSSREESRPVAMLTHARRAVYEGSSPSAILAGSGLWYLEIILNKLEIIRNN